MTPIRVAAPPGPNASEAVFKKWLDGVARAWQWKTMHVYRAQLADGSWRTTTTATGWPDWTAVRGSRLIFAELKGPKGKVEPEQDAWLDALANVCDEIECYVWRPVNADEVIRILAPDT